MSLPGMLRSVGVLQRSASTKDASGGAVKASWADVGEETACDVQPASGSVRIQYLRLQMVVTHTVYVAGDVEARQGDRWYTGGRYFLVQGYTPPAPGYGSWPGRIDAEEQVEIDG